MKLSKLEYQTNFNRGNRIIFIKKMLHKLLAILLGLALCNSQVLMNPTQPLRAVPPPFNTQTYPTAISIDPFPSKGILEYPPPDVRFQAQAEQQKQLSSAIDTLLNFNLKMCSTCESLKYFAIKFGNNNATTLTYLTVASICLGSLNFQLPSGPSGRPGNSQLFLATQLQDQTWLLEPRNCPGNYIRATSASTVAVVNGLAGSSRFWIQYHMNHVHMQSAAFASSYWNGVSPLQIGPGASPYIVQFWPSRAWP